MSKIYTKTGDQRETSLRGGKRVKKSCVTLQVIGEIDELNSTLGEAVAHMAANRGVSTGETADIVQFLQSIQRDLFKAGTELALAQFKSQIVDKSVDKVDEIGMNCIKELEIKIDRMWADLPELKNFILPGGGLAGAHLHHARAVCRRVERALVEFGKKQAVRPELYKYFNRLSDFLFAAARWVNWKNGHEEIVV